MVGWFSKSKTVDIASVDIANAQALLPKLSLQLDKVGTRTTLSYGQGVAEVSRGLAHSFRPWLCPMFSEGALRRRKRLPFVKTSMPPRRGARNA
jgi:hypothetical protein